MPYPALPPQTPALISQFNPRSLDRPVTAVAANPSASPQVTVRNISARPVATLLAQAGPENSGNSTPLPPIAPPELIRPRLPESILPGQRLNRPTVSPGLPATSDPASPNPAESLDPAMEVPSALPSVDRAQPKAPSAPPSAELDPPSESAPPALPSTAPTSTTPVATPASAPTPASTGPTSTSPAATTTPAMPTQRLGTEGILELKADRQDYDQFRQIFTAEGNVSMRFRGALLTADRLQVNLANRLSIAEGNVVLTKGEQILRGQRFDYNFVQEQGTIQQAGGTIFLPSTGSDLATTLPTDVSAGALATRSVSDRLAANQPPQNVVGTGGAQINVGSQRNQSGAQVTPTAGGTVKRLRFEADQIEFYPDGWLAKNVRITNDPFSPPELELRAQQAQLRRLSPLRDEVVATRPRLVFDQRFTLPIFQRRVVLDRTERQPGLINFGLDTTDRGGVFIERRVDVISQEALQFSITPQVLVQKALQGEGDSIADYFGVKTSLNANLGPRTSIKGSAVLTSLNLAKVEDNLRASLRAGHLIGTHTLSIEGSYRDRLFNNSLGFQDIQSSIGALFYSPVTPLGKTGINLSYQVGYQFINADTDRADLLKADRQNNRISLGRFQSSVALNRGFLLWQGKPLPPTATAGLRYTPTPVVPYLSMNAGLTGVATAYSNGDNQRNLNASVGLFGQFGHFSRRWFDYTGFNITYSQVIRDGLSPFLFDRVADDKILFAGISQQIYGPLRIGFQTAYNVETAKEISTDYTVEYSRRTYSVALRYNPILQLGSISLRISDFNWTGGSEPFAGSGVTTVEGGVRRGNE